jgi:hypothetical protein
MDVHGAAVLPAHEVGDVVHPRVVGAQLAAPDQHDAAVAVARKRGPQAVHVGDDRLRRKLDLPARGAQDLGYARFQRAEVDAVRRSFELRQRQPRRIRAEVVTVWPGAQHPVQHALWSAARLERRDQLLGVAAGER